MVREATETAKPEQPVASVTVPANRSFLPVVVAFVRQTVHHLGLTKEAADHLSSAVGIVCRNVVENAFEPGEENRYEVYVLRRTEQVAVVVEDRGLPGDYDRVQDAGDSPLSAMLQRSFADEARFVNLGRGGNRVELVKNLPRPEMWERAFAEGSRGASESPEDAPLEIRMMRPEEALALSRSVYRSYGYSYDWDDIYYPERIQELQEKGLMRSCVAIGPGGEIAGHLAVMVEDPDSPVGEAGQAVVDPRFRGHHLFENMKNFLAEESRKRGMCGLYSEATAIHPYSQKGNLHLGARETGFLLGYIPASVSYKDIGDARAGRRGSVALMYLRVNQEPRRKIYPPLRYEELVREVTEHNGLRRDIIHDPETSARTSQMDVEVRRGHNVAFLRVVQPGVDLRELVQVRLRELRLHRVDCVYVDLPLSHPATREAGDALADLGFFFGCVIPEVRAGDVLRLQYLNNVEVNENDVHAASDFGKGLLGTIFREYERMA